MSASQQSVNKKLHKYIDWLERETVRLRTERNKLDTECEAQAELADALQAQIKENEALAEERDEFQQSAVDALGKVEDLRDRIHQLDAENSRLLHLVRDAWQAGVMHQRWPEARPDINQWMKQKGLT